MMGTTSLPELIRRAQQRDPDAFDTLVEAYSPRLYGYLYRLTGSRHDAEDLLQEVFVRVVRTIDGYEDDGRFDGWVFRIATNLVRDRVRRVRASGGLRLARGMGGEESDPLDEVADGDEDSPAASLERSEQIDRMQAAIAKLPEAEREVIMLRHFSQLSFREIAEMMDTPLGTALARAHRGLARLRELMGESDRV